MKYKKDLLSYTSSIIKIIISLAVVAWLLQTIDDNNFAYTIVIAVIGYVLIFSVHIK